MKSETVRLLALRSSMMVLILILLLTISHPVEAFCVTTSSSCSSSRRLLLRPARNVARYEKLPNNWDRDIEERSRLKAAASQQQGGIGETAAGAVLGGLLGGPFGALFGASMGSRMGAQKALNKARQQEMERLGLTQDMLDTANSVGLALERSNEGLKAVQDSLDTQQRLARRLEADAKQLYEKAQRALTENNQEEQARQWLMQRTEVQDKLKQVLKNCAEERQRLQKMEDNVEQLQRRALEVETLMRRSVSAKTLSSSELALPVEDPLLQKFKDLGID